MGKRKRQDRDNGGGGQGNSQPKKAKTLMTQQWMGFRSGGGNRYFQNQNMTPPAAAVGGGGGQGGFVWGNNGPSPWAANNAFGGGGQVSPWASNQPPAATSSSGGANNSMNFQSFESAGGQPALQQQQDPQQANVITPMDPASFRRLASKYVVRETDIPRSPDGNSNPHQGVGSRHQKLSRAIWRHFTGNQQSSKVFEQKLELWAELERVLRRRVNGTTHIFGSTLNGFAGAESDMDVCLFIDRSDYTDMSPKRAQQCDVALLANVRKLLRRFCGNYLSANIELIPAKVPILKFYDRYGKIEVDMSCNNPTCVRNTNLLFAYSQLDWRVRPLVLAIKTWAKNKGINEAKNATMSSYLLSLMVIHFLQAGVEPPVLPSLQKLHPETFHSDSYIFTLPFVSGLPEFRSDNGESLGELLSDFFEYYDRRFDFATDVGSVRTGERVANSACYDFAKANRLSPKQWEAYICMEEPFDRTNAGRAVIKRPEFDGILQAFKTAAAQLSGAAVDFQTIIQPVDE